VKKKHSNKPVHKPTVWNYLNLILLLLVGEITRQSIHCPTSNTIMHKNTHTHCRGNDFSLVLSPTSFSGNGYVGKRSKVPSQTLFCTLSLQIQKGTAHACNRKLGEKREIEKKVVRNFRFFTCVLPTKSQTDPLIFPCLYPPPPFPCKSSSSSSPLSSSSNGPPQNQESLGPEPNPNVQNPNQLGFCDQ